LGRSLLRPLANLGLEAGKGRRKEVQVSKPKTVLPFKKSKSKETEDEVVVVPEAPSASRETAVEAGSTTLKPSLNLPLLSRTDVGGRLLGFRNAWKHNSWAFQVVSRGLNWSWFPNKPPSNCKGQASTPLLKAYIAEMLDM